MSAAVDNRRLRRNFSRGVDHYDHHAHIQKQVVTALLQFMEPRCSVHGTFLDIGCGTGSLSYALCQSYPQLQPILTDIAHGMTVHGRSRIAKALAVDAEAEALPFADRSVDMVCSSSVYQWVLDLPGAFFENLRILRDGGLFAFALFGRDTLKELKTAYRQAAEACGSEIDHLHELPELSTVHRALIGSGFVQVELQRQELVEYHGGVAELLRSLKRIGAGNASPRAPRGLASRHLLQNMTDIYRRRYAQDGRIPASYEVIYGLATAPPR